MSNRQEPQLELPKTITDLLRGIDDNSDADKGYILAASFNLYLEAMRRVHGRVLLHPGDIRAVFDMAYTMLVKPPAKEEQFVPQARDRELTVVEQDQLLNAVAEEPRRKVAD